MRSSPIARLALTALISFALIAFAAPAPAPPDNAPADPHLIVHEWGTFTSIAGENGLAVDWRPQAGPRDLPTFVYGGYKGHVRGRIRMETPVVYFYTDRETPVSVQVDFPGGQITEWYPQARLRAGGIEWGSVTVLPGDNVSFPNDGCRSHYYAARETDAAPLRVQSGPPQHEKFLFYRGVGAFQPPLSAELSAMGEKVRVTNLGHDPIRHLILFENQGGRVGYQIYKGMEKEATLYRPMLGQNVDSLQRELAAILTEHGLYPPEAAAMIKTWRDSWFEEGTRLFYLVPREMTDSVLPLRIQPRPAEMVRVLVGRVEIITPQMEKQVRAQVERLGDTPPSLQHAAVQSIHKYGRIAEPILRRIQQKTPELRARIEKLIQLTNPTPAAAPSS